MALNDTTLVVGMPSRTTPPQSAQRPPVTVMESKRNWREAGFGLLLFISVVVVYWPSLSADFIWDDDDYVTRNLTLRSLNGLWRIWAEPTATPQYYPVVHTTFWVEYHLWGLNPAGYHFVNVLLHAANSVLVAVLLRKLNWPAAWLAAVFFGLHPVHVESVSWVTERKNVLSGFFYLLALMRLLDFWRVNDSPVAAPAHDSLAVGNFRDYLAGALLFVAALLSKSVTCSLPAVLLLILWQKQGKVTIRDGKFLLPLFIIGLALSINTIWLERTKVGASGKEFDFTLLERMLIAGRALWFYAGKIVLPVHLSFIYPRWSLTANDPVAWIAAVSACLVPIVMAVRAKKMTGPLVAILFFYGTLLPALGFFNIYPMRYSFVADHFQYLASLGVISLVAAVIARQADGQLLGKRTGHVIRALVCIVAVTVLVSLTWQRQFVFQNPHALWIDTLAKNPTCMLAHYHLGKIASDAGKFAEAEHHFRESQRYRTDQIDLVLDLCEWASLLARQQKYSAAIEKLREALEVEPSNFDVLNDWGTYEAEQGHYDVAIGLFERALAENPHKAAIGRGYARLNLATALWNAGQTPKVERELRAALQEAPADAPTDFLASAQYMLAKILVQQGRWTEADTLVRQVLRLNSGFSDARQLQREIQQQLQRNPAIQ